MYADDMIVFLTDSHQSIPSCPIYLIERMTFLEEQTYMRTGQIGKQVKNLNGGRRKVENQSVFVEKIVLFLVFYTRNT